jgi:hypothetical protein
MKRLIAVAVLSMIGICGSLGRVDATQDRPRPPAPPAAQPVPVAEPERVPDPNWVPRPGDLAVIYHPQRMDAVATSDMLAMEDAIKAGNSGDSTGMKELMERREIFSLPHLTRVRVIELRRDTFLPGRVPVLEIRVESGEHEGKKLYILPARVAQLVVRSPAPPEFIPGSNLPRGKVRPVPKRLPPRPVDPATRAASTLQMGKNVRFQGNRPGAIEYFRRAIKEAPGSPAAKEAEKLLGELGERP